MAGKIQFAIKESDTYPALVAQLKADGHPVDLIGSTVVFSMWLQSSQVVKITNQACTFVTDGSDGKVQFEFSAAESDTPGIYEGEFRVTFPGGEVGTFPPDDDDNIIIKVGTEIA